MIERRRRCALRTYAFEGRVDIRGRKNEAEGYRAAAAAIYGSMGRWVDHSSESRARVEPLAAFGGRSQSWSEVVAEQASVVVY